MIKAPTLLLYSRAVGIKIQSIFAGVQDPSSTSVVHKHRRGGLAASSHARFANPGQAILFLVKLPSPRPFGSCERRRLHG